MARRNIPLLRTVLFVGCESYTAHYQRRYFPEHDYWTIDRDAARRRHGAKQHIITHLTATPNRHTFNFYQKVEGGRSGVHAH